MEVVIGEVLKIWGAVGILYKNGVVSMYKF